MARECPDCNTPLKPIRLLNAMDSRGLLFTTPEAQASWWTGAVAAAGSLQPYLCPGCGRVLFYAVFGSDNLPRAAEQPESPAQGLPIPHEGTE